MKESLAGACALYNEARETVRSVCRLESDYIYPAAASVFVAAGKAPDRERLTECKQMVKSSAGVFSNYRGNVQLPLICMLAADDDPQRRWERTQDNYRLLKEAFFGSSFLVLVSLLLCDLDPSDVEALAERGKSLYRRMRKEHPILTGQEDSVFAVLLAETGRDEDALIQDMEACYQLLDQRFPKGDGIQSASHALALSDRPSAEKTRRMIALYDAVTAGGEKYGKSFELAVLAALSLSDEPVETLAGDILDVGAFLAEQKGYGGMFGFDRRTRMLHAAMLVAAARSDRTANAAAQQSTLAIVAAQQAMLCAVAATTAASSAH